MTVLTEKFSRFDMKKVVKGFVEFWFNFKWCEGYTEDY